MAATAAHVTDREDRAAVVALAAPLALRRFGAYREAPPDAPLTEPLLPALAATIEHWSALGDPAVIHDEQSLLTPARVAAIGTALTEAHPGRRVAAFDRVDSRDDPRVQLADLVAGVVRRAVEDALAPTGPTEPAPVRIDHLVVAGSVLVTRPKCEAPPLTT